MPKARGLSPSVTRVNLQLRIAEQALGRGDLGRARDVLESAWTVVSNSLEPQFIAAVAVLRTELELRERNVEAARAIADDGLDKIQFCTEDGTRIARIAAAATAVEAAAAQLGARRRRRRRRALRRRAGADARRAHRGERRGLERPGRAGAARRRPRRGRERRRRPRRRPSCGWPPRRAGRSPVRPYEEARARLRAAEALVGQRPRGAPRASSRPPTPPRLRLGATVAGRGGRGARRPGPDPARRRTR